MSCGVVAIIVTVIIAGNNLVLEYILFVESVCLVQHPSFTLSSCVTVNIQTRNIVIYVHIYTQTHTHLCRCICNLSI